MMEQRNPLLLTQFTRESLPNIFEIITTALLIVNKNCAE
jgi:hypothetical protein